MNTILKKRAVNMDILRLLATFSVIMLHCSTAYSFTGVGTEFPKSYYWGGVFYGGITSAAIPIFFMLTGAMCIAPKNYQNWKGFYKKSLIKLGIPTIVFSGLYMLYSLLIGRAGITTILVNALKGVPFYHLWYMYALISIYLVIPLLSFLKEYVKKSEFLVLTLIAVISGVIYQYTADSAIVYGIDSLKYVGYVMLGSVLYSSRGIYAKYAKQAVFIGVVIIYSEIIYLALSSQMAQGLTVLDIRTIIGSALIFWGFSNCSQSISERVNRIVGHFANHTFMIYIIHAGVKDILYRLQVKLYHKPNSWWYIPVFSFVVFILSYCGSIIISSLISLLKKCKNKEGEL